MMEQFLINGNVKTMTDDREEAIDYATDELGLYHFKLVSDKGREYEILVLDELRYRLSSTKHSSQRYGNCEVCGKHASEVFVQVEEIKIADEVGRWYRKTGTIFGHEECLRQARNQ